MEETLEGHRGGVRCARRRITDLRFTNVIDMRGEDENNLHKTYVSKRIEETAKR